MDYKYRLDVVLAKRNFFDSREKAKRAVMAGIVFIDNQRVDKPGTQIPLTAKIEVKGNSIPYVSRGGLKLEKALKEFNIDLYNKTALDIGASTGGFTDCMLQNDAQKVFAIDVGYGQLAWKLRQNPKVIPIERTNIRYVKKSDIGEETDFASIDVSFISLTLVLPVVKKLVKKRGEIVCLIKPQFEAGRELVGKKGVIKDEKIHIEVIQKILSYAIQIGYTIEGLTFSPIKGPEGNIEYLAYLINEDTNPSSDVIDQIHHVVSSSHNKLKKR